MRDINEMIAFRKSGASLAQSMKKSMGPKRRVFRKSDEIRYYAKDGVGYKVEFAPYRVWNDEGTDKELIGYRVSKVTDTNKKENEYLSASQSEVSMDFDEVAKNKLGDVEPISEEEFQKIAAGFDAMENLDGSIKDALTPGHLFRSDAIGWEVKFYRVEEITGETVIFKELEAENVTSGSDELPGATLHEVSYKPGSETSYEITIHLGDAVRGGDLYLPDGTKVYPCSDEAVTWNVDSSD